MPKQKLESIKQKASEAKLKLTGNQRLSKDTDYIRQGSERLSIQFRPDAKRVEEAEKNFRDQKQAEEQADAGGFHYN